MKDFYTIGETAELLGVTTQTLRYYDKIALLSPCHKDPDNGYRYYSYKQFHLIDRVRYLQSFGMSLDKIRDIIVSGKVDLMLDHLRQERAETVRTLSELRGRLDDIDWYINCFSYMGSQDTTDNLYVIRQPERSIIKCSCYYQEPLSSMEIRLAGVKSRQEYRQVKFHRQYGYKLDVESLFRREFYPREYFIFLSGKPPIDPSLYEVLPAGEYVCLRTQLLHESWNADMLAAFFSNKERPRLALALEFEDNLHDWSDAWYELQLLI